MDIHLNLLWLFSLTSNFHFTISQVVSTDNTKIEFRALNYVNFNLIVASGYSKDPEANRMFLYVARKVDSNGDVVCGQYIPKARLFFWSHLGSVEKAPSTDEGIEILYYPRGSVVWVPEDHPLLPAYTPIYCGRHSKSPKKRYFCRAIQEGTLLVGVKEDGADICKVTTSDGTQVELKSYETLILSEYGKMINAYVDDADDDDETENLSPCWVSLANLKKHGAKPLGFEFKQGQMFEFFSARFAANHGRDYAVGKFSVKTNGSRGSFNYNGKVFIADDFAVLDFPQGTLSWVTNKKVVRTSAKNRMVGNYMGKNLYICRAKLEGNLVLGQYDTEKKHCDVPYNGKPEHITDCEIVVINDYGKSLGVTNNIRECQANKPKNRIWGGRALFL